MLPRATLSAIIALATVATACSMETPIIPREETVSLGLRASEAQTWEPTAAEPVTLVMQMASTVKRNGQLPIRVRLHNGSSRSIAIGFGQRNGFDLLIAMMDGRSDSGAVWSPLKGGDGRSISREATITDPLRPGADTAFDVMWTGQDDSGRPVPPGKYRMRATVVAELLSTHEIWTPWVPIEVTP